MARFPGRKLPPGWLYVPSRRHVRELTRRSAGDFRRVEFDGTGSGPSSVGLLLGYLERRVVAGAWCFYLRLWGVPESAVGDHRDELASAALRAVEQAVTDCLASPAAAVAKPTQVLLRFAVGPVGVMPKCGAKPVDRYSFSAGDWWAPAQDEADGHVPRPPSGLC